MLKQIVVVMQGAEAYSATRSCALDCAAEIGARTGAEVALLHAEPRDSSELEGLTPYQLEHVNEATEADRLRRLARTRDALRSLRHRIEQEWPVRVDPELAETPVRLTAERLLRVRRGDMLVARHGAAPCPAGFLAPLPERVVRELDIPVLYLNAGTCIRLHGLERVLVPLDGSGYAEAILPLARDFLPPHSGSIHLLLVVPARGSVAALRHPRGIATRAAGGAYLDGVAAQPELAGIRVERTVLVGTDPAESVAGVARDARANLIAMMTRDHGALGRILLGSVTHRLLKDPPTPLLLWRSPSRARARPAAD